MRLHLILSKVILFIVVFFSVLGCSGGGGNSSSTSSDDGTSASKDISLDTAYIVNLSSMLEDAKVEGVLITGQEARINMLNLETDNIKVKLSGENGDQIIIPSKVSLEEQSIVFTTPLNTISGELYILEEDVTLPGVSYKLFTSSTPQINTLIPAKVAPGSSITITGKNLREPSYKVFLNNEDLNITVMPVNNQVGCTLPQQVKSGNIYLKTDDYATNSLEIRIERNLSFLVSLAQDLNFTSASIAFAVDGAELTLDDNFTTLVPVENTMQHLQATVEMDDSSFSHLYSAVVLPDMNQTIVLDANSTAISWIFIGLGASNMPQEQWRSLYDDVATNIKVQDLAEYIAFVQREDFSKWTQLNDPVLKTKLQDALIDVLDKFKLNVSAALTDAYASPSSIVTITQTPINGNIYVDDIDYGYITNSKLNNGSVTIVNDTLLYLSIEAVTTDDEDCMFESNTEGGCIINHYRHINGPFDMSIPSVIAPKSGLLGISNSQEIRLSGKDAHLEIVTGGYNDTTDKINISNILKTHTFIDGVVTPSLNLLLSPLLGSVLPEDHKNQNIIDGLNTIYGPTFLIDITKLVANKDTNWGTALDTILIQPITSGLVSCISTSPDETCTRILNGIAKLYGITSEDYVKELQERLITAAFDRVIKRAVVALPVAGWVLEASIIIYQSYDVISDTKTIADSLYDMTTNPKEMNVDVDFHLKITEVKPMCLGVSPTDINIALYAQGEGFVIEDAGSPEVYIINEGGLKTDATSLDTVTNTKIYAQFDAQRLIDNRSVNANLFVGYGDFFVINDNFIRIVDEGDTIVHFDSIDPYSAVARATITLNGCGWLPFNDIKVFFKTLDGEVEGEVVGADIQTIQVKVPDTAIDGPVYVTTGNKKTINQYFEIKKFGLIEADIEVLNENVEVVLNGEGLDRVTNIFFVDSLGTKMEGTLHDINISSLSVIADIPATLYAGEVKVYAMRDDGLETNALKLKKLPQEVQAIPGSQGFDGSLTITLTQAEGAEIYYYHQGGETQTYTAPFTINSSEVGLLDEYKLYTYARIVINGVSYNSKIKEYTYIPASSSCPLKYDTTLHAYHSYYSSWFNAIDTDGDGYFDDYLRCSYYSDTENLFKEEPFIDNSLHGITRIFYNTGRLQSEGNYINGNKDGIFNSYYDSGQLNHMEIYVNGSAEGVHISYYEDGTIWSETTYLNNQRDGTTKSYYDTGILRALSTYSAGILHGLQQSYYETGQLKSNGYNIDWKKDGVWTTYFESGVTESTITYTLGVRNGMTKIYFDTAVLNRETPYVDGKKEGTEKIYYATGTLYIEAPYTNNQKNGLYKEYWETAGVHFETTYVNDLKEGAYKGYYITSELQYTGTYQNNLKDGEFKEYSLSGDLIYCQIFVEGVYTGSCMP
ncbi:IPT/TIG domain-containing protein [bacterium]|nr:IPT/TIG domain-containing protein [bacterium]MBU1990231.1 IPT/TIG domain-containing protein [bacterium]